MMLIFHIQALTVVTWLVVVLQSERLSVCQSDSPSVIIRGITMNVFYIQTYHNPIHSHRERYIVMCVCIHVFPSSFFSESLKAMTLSTQILAFKIPFSK